jgi:hypothetical protein
MIKYINYDESKFPVEIKELLNEWDLVLKKFEKVLNSEDIPYIYGERANIGFLAAAATKLGYIVLEEYAIERRKEKHWQHGRADLWLYSTDDSFDASIEAKIAESSWNSNRVPDIIRGAFKEVISEAKQVKQYEKPMHSIALIFLRPYNADPGQYNTDDYWNKLNDPSKYGADFCAMHLCKYCKSSGKMGHN